MPQAPQHLQDEFGDDAKAWEVISENFTQNRGGIIYPRNGNYTPVDKEMRAIDYLILEWDYGYSKEKPVG